MLNHEFEGRSFTFDLSGIYYGSDRFRPTHPQLIIPASINEVWEDGAFECAYNSRLAQSCQPLLDYIDEHFSEYLI